MSVKVCVYLCVYLCVYICLGVCVCVCVCVYVCACPYASLCLCLFRCVCVWWCAGLENPLNNVYHSGFVSSASFVLIFTTNQLPAIPDRACVVCVCMCRVCV